ncbi:MAG: UvrB/UvrC motif-containing protein [Phycisphaerales bacterium]|nr:UvrB/UvrC motif-containing protein [Phycisphaerales bacterium]
MKRKCDRCDREATVTEVLIKHGKKVERHLCEQCAAGEGIAVQSHVNVGDLLTNFIVQQSGAGEQKAAKGVTCSGCGTSFADFKQRGLLGCPECYASMEPQLGPLIERAHEGATHHVGKTPRRSGAAPDTRHRIAALRKQLQDAIDAEQYERAAALRDELRSAEAPAPAPSDDAAPRTRRPIGGDPQ